MAGSDFLLVINSEGGQNKESFLGAGGGRGGVGGGGGGVGNHIFC